MNEYYFDETTFIGGWFIEEQICDDIVKFFYANEQAHQVGKAYTKENGHDTVNKDVKDSKEIYISKQHVYHPFFHYRVRLQNCLKKYIEKYPNANNIAPYDIWEDYNVQWYPKGGGFKQWHSESGTPDRAVRQLVFMTYLNDVEDGGTEFLHQKITCPSKKGLTIIWPAGWTHMHRGQISYTEEKMIVTGWYSYNA